MRLDSLIINGFKSFPKKTSLTFESPVVCVVGPNGSGKSNVAEAIRFVLGEQSMKSMRGKAGSDLIFKGSKSLPAGSRASVSIYFNNEDKVFKLTNDEGEYIDLNYDVISISREVYPDGVNKYLLNDSEVRLKDIHNLLSSVNIGSSGHHIISQGEADRILNASAKERKEMIEDALGLKIYQYKIKETDRKLIRTRDNMQEVSLLRRENAPHLKFLQKQVEKIEKAKELSALLLSLYKEYLKRESVYLAEEENTLSSEKREILIEMNVLSEKISETEENGEASAEKNIKELDILERKSMDIRRLKNELERGIGRIEGMMEVEKERAEKITTTEMASPEDIKIIIDEVEVLVEEATEKENLIDIRAILLKIKSILKNLYRQPLSKESFSSQLDELENKKQDILSEMEKIEREEKDISIEMEKIREENREKMEAMRLKEKEKFGLKVRQQELVSLLGMISIKEENLAHQKEDFETEIKEGEPLVGKEIMSYKDFIIEGLENRALQEERRKKIERIKIKLEDAGLSNGSDILKEYNEAQERDSFLLNELEDLEKSIKSLEVLINDLKEKIDTEFKEGIKKINKEFQELFSLMFGGGTARLDIKVESKGREQLEEEDGQIFEEIVFEKGIEINVSLPHKRVKELHALSGGERSLTSIALLFAMSAVNPPPFLVLDETDAALDEANSRKYGDMLEILSRHSQLVVITHNRETMSRAGILYGVTIGSDGASKLLSVRFEEAVAIAK